VSLRSTGRDLCGVVLSFVVVSVRLLRVVFIVFIVDTRGAVGSQHLCAMPHRVPLCRASGLACRRSFCHQCV
jgi:hypothetical protein